MTRDDFDEHQRLMLMSLEGGFPSTVTSWTKMAYLRRLAAENSGDHCAVHKEFVRIARLARPNTADFYREYIQFYSDTVNSAAVDTVDSAVVTKVGSVCDSTDLLFAERRARVRGVRERMRRRRARMLAGVHSLGGRARARALRRDIPTGARRAAQERRTVRPIPRRLQSDDEQVICERFPVIVDLLQ